jgi:hypothetical protein
MPLRWAGISNGSPQPMEVIRMFYWGLLIGLIIGANIGVVVAGLFSRHKQKECDELLTQEPFDWAENRPLRPKKPSSRDAGKPYPSE